MADRTSIPVPVRSALLGVFSGGRSMTPLAILALNHDRGSVNGAWEGSPAGRAVIVLTALGELVADKLPMTPSRRKPLPLFGRIAAGALVGAAIGTNSGPGGWRQSALLGGLGGMIGTFAGALLRSGGAATGLPDIVTALVEDVVTVSGSAVTVSSR